jgi:uncharacterized protein YtpQ (UPF0354 family)
MSLFKKLFRKKESNSTIESAFYEKPFSEVSAKIYPYFKQFLPSNGNSIPLPDDFKEIKKDETYDLPGVSLIFKNICEDLNCLYVFDTGNSFEIIQESHIQAWGVDQHKLHEYAIENFRTMITQRLSARGDTNGIMFVLDGNLEAGLVLIDEIWEQYEDQVGEKIVITVPSRDVIMATGVSNRAMIDQFKQNSKRILLEGEYPLSKNLFIRESSQWNLFEKIID